MSTFKRVVLTGTLRAESNLHIGSGEDEDIPDGQSLYNELVLDAKGLAYIPASSLRGLLRSRIEDSAIRQKLFGLGRQEVDSEQTGNSGHARIYDALIDPETRASRIISRTSIDPLTAAAKEHHLSAHRVIEPGAEFSVHIALDHPGKPEIEALLVALSGFGTAPDCQIGKGKSVGQGRLNWQLGEIRVLSEAKLKQWLSTSRNPASKAQSTTAKYKNIDEADVIEGNKTTLLKLFEPETFAIPNAVSGWKSREVVLNVESPILINDPARIEAREKLYDLLKEELDRNNLPRSFIELKLRIDRLASFLDGVDDPKCVREIQTDLAEFSARCDKPTDPTDKKALKDDFGQLVARFENPSISDAMYMRHQHQACIPGSTLKGWARGQCRKIMLTLQDSKDGKGVDQLLDTIFGGTEHGAGCLRFDDALADVDEAKHLHPQTFNAVDRFTGGVKPGALFNVEAAWPEAFAGTVHYRADLLKGWMKILLLYVLRDAEQGDLVVGWGKSKGFGRLRLKPVLKDLDFFDESSLELWHQLLLDRLNQTKATS